MLEFIVFYLVSTSHDHVYYSLWMYFWLLVMLWFYQVVGPSMFFLSSFHSYLSKHSSCIFELISCSNIFKLCEVFYHKSISKLFDFLLHYIQYNSIISHIPNIYSLALEVTDFGRNTSMDVHILSTPLLPLQISADFHWQLTNTNATSYDNN